jgi:hypothetical protein
MPLRQLWPGGQPKVYGRTTRPCRLQVVRTESGGRQTAHRSPRRRCGHDRTGPGASRTICRRAHSLALPVHQVRHRSNADLSQHQAGLGRMPCLRNTKSSALQRGPEADPIADMRAAGFEPLEPFRRS